MTVEPLQMIEPIFASIDLKMQKLNIPQFSVETLLIRLWQLFSASLDVYDHTYMNGLNQIDVSMDA